MTQNCEGSGAFDIIDSNTISSVISGFSCVRIPSSIEFIKAGTSSSYAFKPGINDITEIDFSEATNLKEIGDFAFSKCSKVLSFNLSKCILLSKIGYMAFSECKGCKSIILPIDSPLNFLAGGTFNYCSSLESFIVPQNIVKIDTIYPYASGNEGVFANCMKLTSIVFGGDKPKIESIGIKAFFLSGIISIKFPASLKSITGESFRGCPNLERIEVDKDNKVYSAVDGILLSEQGTALVYYPDKACNSETAILPSSVKKILRFSFIGDSKYKTVNLTNVLSFEPFAFDRVDCFTHITIPKTIVNLSDSLFNQCSKLNNITFEGTYELLNNGIFSHCTAFTSFNIPSGVISIGSNAFFQCTSLKYVFIPNTVTTLGTAVFSGCPNDIHLEFEDGSTIRYTQDGYLYDSSMTTLILYLGESKDAYIKDSVQKIGKGAFQGKLISSLTWEAISNCKTIESFGFSDCSLLTSIELPDISTIPEYCFKNCISLSSIQIPENAMYIQSFAFADCIQLNNVTFTNDNLNQINQDAFYNCSSLTQIQLPSSLHTIDQYSFSYSGLTEITLPEGISSINQYAFSNSPIKTLNFPSYSDSYLTIKSESFSYLHSLTSLTIPDYITTIDDSAFSSCDSLTDVTFGSNLKTIDNYAFSKCYQLQTVHIPSNFKLTELKYLIFDNCPSLLIFDCNEQTSNFIFKDSILFDKDLTTIFIFLRANKPSNVTIPEGVETIYSYAFSDCESLETVEIKGNTLKTIQPYAFQGCSSLSKINFPESLEQIETGVFNNCNLRSLYLATTNIKIFASLCFANNPNLIQVIFPTNIQEINSKSFQGSNRKAIIYYFGDDVVSNEAGFSSTAKAIVSPYYKSTTFLTLPAFVTPLNIFPSFNCQCNNQLSISYFAILIFTQS